LRKLRFVVVAVIAMFSLAGTALAANVYDFSGKVPSGGSKAKPKIAGFSFNYSIGDDAGMLPVVVKAYKFTIAGTRVNTGAVKTTCAASKINAAGSDDGCSSKAIVGTGSVHADIGTAGQPASAKCDLKLTAYAGGPNKVALFLSADTTTCVTAINQAIDAKWANSSKGAGLSFTVPDELRHQLGLDISVTSVKSTWKKLTGKKGKKKIGYFESIGCKGQRSATVNFTAEDGTVTPLTKTIGKC
jgi:hypothetical protein